MCRKPHSAMVRCRTVKATWGRCRAMFTLVIEAMYALVFLHSLVTYLLR